MGAVMLRWTWMSAYVAFNCVCVFSINGALPVTHAMGTDELHTLTDPDFSTPHLNQSWWSSVLSRTQDLPFYRNSLNDPACLYYTAHCTAFAVHYIISLCRKNLITWSFFQIEVRAQGWGLRSGVHRAIWWWWHLLITSPSWYLNISYPGLCCFITVTVLDSYLHNDCILVYINIMY